MKKRTNQQPKNPVHAHTKCPACKCKSLIRLEVDVLCTECDWMSAEVYVASGGMDNIYGAYLDHFSLHPNPAPAEPTAIDCELVMDESA